MATRISELLETSVAIDKLGARAITVEGVGNSPPIAIRFCTTRAAIDQIGGCWSGKRTEDDFLTVIIEEIADEATWLIVTAWNSTDRERRLLD